MASKKYVENSKLNSFAEHALTPQEQAETKGGFILKMIDDFRCNVDRTSNWLFGTSRGGGNGDSAW